MDHGPGDALTALPDDPLPSVVRLFPLPGCVLFPHGLLPLHVFEPRYRQMTRDALAGDRRIAIAVPLEPEAAGRPPTLHPTVCVGRISDEQRFPDGRYKFILRGEGRMRLEAEQPGDRLYRQARVTPLPDTLTKGGKLLRGVLRADVVARLRRLVLLDADATRQFYTFLTGLPDDGAFADVVAHAAPVAPSEKLELLDEPSVDRRLELLAAALPGPEGREPTLNYPLDPGRH